MNFYYYYYYLYVRFGSRSMLIKVRVDLSVSVCALGLTMVALVVEEIWGEVPRDYIKKFPKNIYNYTIIILLDQTHRNQQIPK